MNPTPESPVSEEPRAKSFWPFMFTLFVGSFMAVLSSSTITIAIPELQRYFNADLTLLQWTLTSFMLAMGTSAPLTGYLGGRFSFVALAAAPLSLAIRKQPVAIEASEPEGQRAV